MKKILVFGANGFIGSNLVRYLSNNSEYEIWGTYRNSGFKRREKVTYIPCDLSEEIEIAEKFDAVIDCVSQVELSDGADYVSNTVMATEHAIRFCEKMGIRVFIFLSSISVYGITKTEVDENSPYQEVGNYGLAKLMAENIVRESGITNVFSLRIPRILGFGVNFTHQWLPALAYKLAHNSDVRYFNKDLLYNNLLYVDDLAKFLLTLIIKSSDKVQETFVLGAGGKETIYGIILKMREYLKSSSKLIQGPNNLHTTVFATNIKKAVSYGFSPMDVSDTLKRFAIDVREQIRNE